MFQFLPFEAETNKKAMENHRQRAIYLQTRLPEKKKGIFICFCRTNLQWLFICRQLNPEIKKDWKKCVWNYAAAFVIYSFQFNIILPVRNTWPSNTVICSISTHSKYYLMHIACIERLWQWVEFNWSHVFRALPKEVNIPGTQFQVGSLIGQDLVPSSGIFSLSGVVLFKSFCLYMFIPSAFFHLLSIIEG